MRRTILSIKASLIALAVSVGGFLTAEAQCPPPAGAFTETFDPASASLGCWTQNYVVGAKDWTFVAGAGGGLISADHTGGGENAKHTSTNVAGDITELISPVLDLSGLTAPELTYWHAQENWAGDQNTLTVKYRTAVGAWTNLVPTDGANINTWTEVTGIVLPGFNATYQIAFEALDTWGRAVVVDDVVVADPPSCLDLTLASATAIAEDQIDISWTNGNAAPNTYSIICATCPSSPYTGTLGVGTTTVSITGLTPETAYSFDISENCNPVPGGVSGTVTVGATTPCAVVSTIPFIESFDPASTTRNCWTQNYVVGAKDWVYIAGATGGLISADHTGGGENARHTSSNVVGDVTELISPVLDLSSLTAPELTYWHAQENWAGDQNTLTVKYRTAPGAWTNLVPLDGADVNSWTEVADVVLPTPSATYQIAFEALDTWGHSVVVDDVLIQDPPTCLPLSLASATAIAGDQIDISWTNGNAVPTTYNIVCATCPSSPYTGNVSGAAGAITTVSITGLTPETTYSFDLNEDCTASTGGTTLPVTVGATTPCLTVTAPWLEDFEATSTTRGCWTNEFVSGTGPSDWFLSTGNGSAVSAANSGTENARHTSQNGTFVTKYVSPTLDITAIASPTAQYYYSQEEWAGDQNVLRVYERTTPGGAWALIGDHSGDLDVDVWTLGQIGGLTSSATYQLAFEGTDTWGRAITLDDVEVLDLPVCEDPTDMTCTAISDTEVEITWTNGQDATPYTIVCAACPGTPYTGTTGTTTTSVTISGLTPATAYSFDLDENCGGLAGNSATVNCASTTLCAPIVVTGILPFYEEFETASATRPCWSQEQLQGTLPWVYTTGAAGGLISTANNGTVNAAHTSSNVPADEAILISPMLDVTALTNIELSFAHAQEEWAGDQNTMTVRYRTGPGAAWNAVTSYTTDYPAWTAETMILPGAANSGTMQIGFESLDTWGRAVVLDDVLVQEAPPCLDPVAFTATAISDTEIQLDWTNGQDDTPYNVTGSGTIPAGSTSNDGSGVTSIVVSGLTANTAYTFFLFEDCASGGGVGVSATLSSAATTFCETINTFPFVETFNSASTTRDCWSTELVVGVNTWTFVSGPAGGGAPFAPFEGDANASFSSSNTPDETSKLVSPIFDLTSLTTPEMSYYDAHADWAGDQNSLEVFYRISITDPWVSLVPLDANDVTTWTLHTVTLPAASASYQVAFEATDTWGRAAVVDQVEIQEAPTCPDATAIVISNNVEDGFDVTFVPGTIGSTGYVEYGAVGFTPGTGVLSAGVTTTASTVISITGATGGQLYDVYVYEDCQPVTFNNPDLSNNVGPTTSYTTGNPSACGFNQAIPDNGGGVVCAEVSIPVTVTGVSMGFDVELKQVDIIIEHFWTDDLDIYLVDPHGVEVELSTDNGGIQNYGVPNADCSVFTSFSMTAASSITTGGTPFPATYIPEGDFDDFNTAALDPNGQWTLKVCDDLAGDVGEIEFVQLTFGDPPGCPNDPYNVGLSNFTETSIDFTFDTDNDGTVTPTTWFVEYGAPGFAQGTGTVVSGSHTGGAGTTITGTISGLPGGTAYEFYFYENCGTAFDSNVIGPESGYTLGNPSACGTGVVINNTLPAAELVLPVSTFPGDNLGVDYVVGEVKVLIEHTWSGDIELELVSPDGIVVMLSDNHGGFGDVNYGDPSTLPSGCGTTANFRDDATVSVTADVPPYLAQASYIPEAPLSGFNGLTNVVNGDWIIRATDNVGGDNGTLEFAEIVFELPPPCQDPQNLVSTAATQTTADFTWFSWNAGSTWTLEYGPVGFTPGAGLGTATGTSVLGASNSGSITGLTAGTQYDVYISEDCGGGDLSGDVGATLFATIPLNDECADAISLAVSNTGYCQTFEVGSNIGATPVVASGIGDPSCSFYDGGDVWFSLVVPASGDVTISTNFSTPVGLTDIGVAAYDACGGTEIGCDDDGGPGFMSELALTGQTAGNTIYIRVFEFGNNAVGSFDICAFEPTENAPINNFPCNAFTLNVVDDCVYTIYANLNATTSITGSCTNGARDVWFKATIPPSGTLVVNTLDFAIGDATMTVHTITDCNDNGTWSEVGCSDDEGVGLMPYLYLDGDDGLTPGQEVFIRVAGWSGTDEGPFYICATQGIVWEGGSSSTFATNGNWFHGGPEPVAGENAIISPNATNDCIVTTGTEQVGSLWVLSNGSISVNAGATLGVDGDLITGSSANNFGDGIVNMNGAAAQEINTSFGTLDFTTLAVNNAAGVTVNPINGDGVININGVLDLAGGNIDVTAGNVTLVSNAAGSAYLDDWNNITNATTGSVIGDITVQTYVAAAGYHHIGPSVDSPDIPSQLAEYGPYGSDGVAVTPIESAGAACIDTTLETGSNYGPIFEWNEGYTNTTDCPLSGWVVRSLGSMENARGYAAQNLGASGSGPFTIAMTGAVNASPVSNGVLGNTGGGGGFHLASNPFATRIEWGSVPGFTPVAYVWNDATGTYSSHFPGTINFSINQGFFVNSTGSSTFTLDNTFKTTGAAPFLRTSTVTGDYSLMINVDGNGFAHNTTIAFASELWGGACTNGWDNTCDAYALPGTSGQPFMYTSAVEGVMPSPNRLQMNTQSLLENVTRSVPLSLDPGANGSFTLSFTDMESFDEGTEIVLEDVSLGIMHNVSNGSYSFSANASDYDPNNPTNRFVVHFYPASVTGINGALNVNANFYTEDDRLVMSLNVLEPIEGMFSVLNAVGQEVISAGNVITANGRYSEDISALANGVYVVSFVSDNETYSAKFVKH